MAGRLADYLTGATALVATGGDRLNLRSGPGSNYAAIEKVSNGTTLTIVGRNAAGDWLQVQVPGTSGALGWVSASFVQVNDPVLAPVTT